MPKIRTHIHLIHPLRQAIGGSEIRTISLYNELKAHCEVSLWSSAEPDPNLLKCYPIQRILPDQLLFPKTSTIVIMGVYFRLGIWPYLARPKRIILLFNTPTPVEFFRRFHRLSIQGLRKVEIVYASKQLEKLIGLPGLVESSPIDIDKFHPTTRTNITGTQHKFTIGRLSRDSPQKHHREDPALYQHLANCGCQLKIMGGVSLTPQLRNVQAISLLPEGAQEPAEFLRKLDCFFYRVSSEWFEAYGRVVAEAMACGLPVVCHNRGGYTEIIEHGRNGFLFTTQAEALGILKMLKDDRNLCHRIGAAARIAMEKLYSQQRRQDIIDFYLGKSIH